MLNIINDHFEVGQKYIGMVNGAELTVVSIKEAGTYESPLGYQYTLSQTQILFRDEKSGIIHCTNMETAKRLLLLVKEAATDGDPKD